MIKNDHGSSPKREENSKRGGGHTLMYRHCLSKPSNENWGKQQQQTIFHVPTKRCEQNGHFFPSNYLILKKILGDFADDEDDTVETKCERQQEEWCDDNV